METKELIRLKKGASIRDVMLIIIMFVGAFGLFFGFVQQNAENAGVEVDSKYNESYNRLLQKQNNVTVIVTDLTDSVKNLSEASIGDYAFFGLRGILKVMQLPIALMSIAPEAWSSIAILIPLPTEISFIITLGIMIVIIFAIIKFVTSRATEA